MRLINVHTLELETFYEPRIPDYAILSHTWADTGEITFQEWADRESASKKGGYSKIVGACQQAIRDGIGHVWVDTNCIDKTSSVELSEAINSMFRWYQASKVCYVYLADVSVPDAPLPANSQLAGSEAFQKSFCASRWFTRGWTLQELLAPKHIVFFADRWEHVGAKTDPELLQCISSATKIRKVFLTSGNFRSASVSERMSWLSERNTSRIEDLAYCMLGIFGIQMPLLYGEGSGAFLRLQEEIIKLSNDQTILCWSYSGDASIPPGYDNVLAPHPSAFSRGSRYSPCPVSKPFAWSLTSTGLSMTVPASIILEPSRLVFLNVSTDQKLRANTAILVGRTSQLDTDALFVRRGKHPLEVPITCAENTATENSELFFKRRDDYARLPSSIFPATEDTGLLLFSQHASFSVEHQLPTGALEFISDGKKSKRCLISVKDGALTSVGQAAGMILMTTTDVRRRMNTGTTHGRGTPAYEDGWNYDHMMVVVVRTERGLRWHTAIPEQWLAEENLRAVLSDVEQSPRDISRSSNLSPEGAAFLILAQKIEPENSLHMGFFFRAGLKAGGCRDLLAMGGYFNADLIDKEIEGKINKARLDAFIKERSLRNKISNLFSRSGKKE